MSSLSPEKSTCSTARVGNTEPLDREVEVDVMALHLTHPSRHINTLIRSRTGLLVIPSHESQPDGAPIRGVSGNYAGMNRQASRVRLGLLELFGQRRRVTGAMGDGDHFTQRRVKEFLRWGCYGAHVEVEARALAGNFLQDGLDGLDGALVLL